jgi:hypothetical protein
VERILALSRRAERYGEDAVTDALRLAGPNAVRYTIVETDIGPLISESRVSVFDVMDAHEAGDSIHEIGLTFNLSPLQVETALAYIACICHTDPP